MELQPLEQRLFMSVTTPSVDESPSAEPALVLSAQPALGSSPSDVLTLADRYVLISNWRGSASVYNDLRAKLDANQVSQFDSTLLTYMRARGNHFFFNHDDIADRLDFIDTHSLSTSGIISRADATLLHKFKTDGIPSNSGTITLPSTINWVDDPDNYSNPEFIHTLNRHAFWLDLAQAHQMTGDNDYVTELITQLSDWMEQNPPLSDPNTWEANEPSWWLLDSAIRLDNWVWTYQMVLDAPSWSAEANTLFLVGLQRHGKFLTDVTPHPATSNRTLFHAKSLLSLGQAFPELGDAPKWESYGRALLFKSMDAQFFLDGAHYEQSPGYATIVVQDLIEAYQLDKLRGDQAAWDTARMNRLQTIIDAQYQLLSPNFETAMLSDTYRGSQRALFTTAGIALETTRWAISKPKTRDVWLFDQATLTPYMSNPESATLTNRGSSYRLAYAGYNVMRSGSGDSATQLIFDTGPHGGNHGHFDLFNFELFSHGRPVISDVGPYKYDNSAYRTYAKSTAAHNTLNVDGLNHATLENAGNPGVKVTRFATGADDVQVTAYHHGYAWMTGSPVVSRSIWYSNGIALVLDWAESVTSHTYSVGFNLPGTTTLLGNSIRSTSAGAGNVKITSLIDNQTISSGSSWVTNDSEGDYREDATRFTISQTGNSAIFANLITTYDGLSAPNISAEIIGDLVIGQSITIRLYQDGAFLRDVQFTPPVIERLPSSAQNRGAANDIQYDSTGRLHMVWFDRDVKKLKYAARETNGAWGAAQIIDASTNVGWFPSLAIADNGVIGVAYFDALKTDLKYAYLDTRDGLGSKSWIVQTVDNSGFTGQNPSLAFSRNNGPVIAYYNKTRGDLRLAVSSSSGWQKQDIDKDGNVGRHPSLHIDPARPTASKWAVAYHDVTNGAIKYAIQSGTGWKIQTVDSSAGQGAGYIALDFHSGDKPAISYFNAIDKDLKIGEMDNLGRWSHRTLAGSGYVGQYSRLRFTSDDRAHVFYYNRTKNQLVRATRDGTNWTHTVLGSGGKEARIDLNPAGGQFAYSALSGAGSHLIVATMAA